MIQTNKKLTFTAETSLNLSPFAKRTSVLNKSQDWRRWGGYLSATQYELHHENEYFAIRTKAALLDRDNTLIIENRNIWFIAPNPAMGSLGIDCERTVRLELEKIN